MKRSYAMTILPALVAACGTAATIDTPPVPPASMGLDGGRWSSGVEAPAATTAAATTMTVRLDQPLGAESFVPGHVVRARVIEPVTLPNGVAVPAGAVVEGWVSGHQPARGVRPELIGVEFERISFDGATHRFDARVIETDMALEDSDLPVGIAGTATLDAATAAVPGTVIANAEEIFVENEMGLHPSAVISLGTRGGATLPEGTRLTLRVVEPMAIDRHAF